ncbi:hypothetical protein HN832_02235 [archaeon]|jgi:hypothetical protein|nr:hypothetical protein [archaeon]MBT4373173.1 hypothetical protein [archaeon]MBT4531518.1 hypothetical protein [archaeon]MBT7001304.1 hypothetical protein [archaeon]MBT7282210.1 hypothetical protein [archaeon]
MTLSLDSMYTLIDAQHENLVVEAEYFKEYSYKDTIWHCFGLKGTDSGYRFNSRILEVHGTDILVFERTSELKSLLQIGKNKK